MHRFAHIIGLLGHYSDKYRLPEFAWFDYVRPLDKDDIFNWRGKKGGTELKTVRRREAPLQILSE